MNKYEALIITGKLQVRLQDYEQAQEEIKKLQKFISDNNNMETAISLGRLSELVAKFSGKVEEEIHMLTQYVGTSLGETKSMQLGDMPIEGKLSGRAVNCLWRGGVFTFEDIPKRFDKSEKLRTLRGLGEKTYNEILDKMQELGFDEYVEKIRAEEKKENS